MVGTQNLCAFSRIFFKLYLVLTKIYVGCVFACPDCCISWQLVMSHTVCWNLFVVTLGNLSNICSNILASWNLCVAPLGNIGNSCSNILDSWNLFVAQLCNIVNIGNILAPWNLFVAHVCNIGNIGIFLNS